MKIVLTGAHGFLGWHTRTRLRALTDHEIVPVGRDDMSDLPRLVADADAVIHVAGVNRAADEVVESENEALARRVADAVHDSSRGSMRVVYANSVQSSLDVPYGRGKTAGAHVLRDRLGAENVVDVVLPNLFGEHGRPGYNSFVATFADAVARDDAPAQVNDKTLPLLHVQDAAQELIDGLEGDGRTVEPAGTPTSVVEVLDRLRSFRETYRSGDIPALLTKLDVDLFNTLRSYLFPTAYPIALQVNSDDRGRLVETVRSHGGQGQTFVSTTRCGITRGEHFHLGKVERFAVLQGKARISLRRTFHDEVIDFDVDGDNPVVIDMPTLWVHNITNVGDTELLTQFWTHTLFDPENPDTFWEPVRPSVEENA